jgi:hypothetical protein
MTTDHSNPQLTQAIAHDDVAETAYPAASGVAGLVAAGAMTALLSGDVRLAVRATRLLIDDDKTSDDGRGSRGSSRRARVWRRTQVSRGRPTTKV